MQKCTWIAKKTCFIADCMKMRKVSLPKCTSKEKHNQLMPAYYEFHLKMPESILKTEEMDYLYTFNGAEQYIKSTDG